MAENRKEMSREDIQRLLGRLDVWLAQRGEKVILFLVGGTNIAMAIDGSRTTTNIDAVLTRGAEILYGAAAAVARSEPELGSEWIRSEFTGGETPAGGLIWQWFGMRKNDTPATLYQGPGLVVQGASPEMMLALKTLANRDQDTADNFELMRRTDLKTPQDLERNLARFAGRRIVDLPPHRFRRSQ